MAPNTNDVIHSVKRPRPPISSAAPGALLLVFSSLMAVVGCGGSSTPTTSAPASSAPVTKEGDERDRVAAQEIVELHDFLLVWFRGDTEHTVEAFRRFEDALAPDFSMTGPDGTPLTRAQVTGGVYADWGRWRDDPAPSIRIENTKIVERGEESIRLQYEEHQTTADGTTVRTSTVALRAVADAPLGYQWVDLVETWSTPPPDVSSLPLGPDTTEH